MSDVVFHAIGLVACCAFAFLGRWIYSHPKLFLEKFLGKGTTHARPAFIFAKLVGALWLFIAVSGILSVLFGWLPERIVSTGPFIGVWVALSALITWQLLRERTAPL
jgi:hypothetical protein